MPFIETQSRFKNTKMMEIQNNANETVAYDIAPLDGYALHNVSLDVYELDPENEYKYKFISRGYSIGSCSVGVDYDFDANPDEIYAKKIDELDENDIMH